MLGLYILVFLGIFYFMMLRPQQVTVGGLHATIHDVDPDQLTLELAPNLRVKADRSAVNYVRGKKDKDTAQATVPP